MNPYASPESDGNSRREVFTGARPEKAPLSWRQKFLMVVTAVTAFLLLFLASYRPGSSAVEDVIVEGRITNEDGRPLANEPVEILLHAADGLTASEARDPASFGASDRFVQVSTDSNGQFSRSFGVTAYHVDNFFFPFHIRIPSQAPPLYFDLRLPRLSPDRYCIYARKKSYKVVPEEGPERQAGSSSDVSISVREKIDGIASIAAFVELRHSDRKIETK